MKKLILVAGARPNFMKIAPILREIERHGSLQAVLVHTGQHYDNNMSETFFRSLELKDPDYFLGAGSGSHAVQTAAVMVAFEKVCLSEQPGVVVVVGDVNSTIAAGLVAKKLQIPLAHVEAGLRSRDRTMPEEINRIATDAISDLFFTTEEEGNRNLLAEGHAREKIHFVGHVMIDNLLYQLKKIRNSPPPKRGALIRSVLPEKYICLTMHRPSNVDDKETFSRLLGAIRELSLGVPVIFPCHPRTWNRINEFGLGELFHSIPADEVQKQVERGLFATEPLAYDDFLYLWKDASLVLTDSGGLQEETTALNVPCITMRENTERPITVDIGSNIVVGTDADKIVALGRKALNGGWKKSSVPPLWDGRASERIVSVLNGSL